MRSRLRPLVFVFLALLFVPATAQQPTPPDPNSQWSTYNGNPAGQHFSSLSQINASTVSHLVPAWVFHTGALSTPGAINKLAAFEANPILWNRTLFLDSPFDQVFALDAITGKELWDFDPHVDRNVQRSLVTSRGVALWHSASTPAGEPRPTCSDRVYVATLDARLIALDATNGQSCTDFGVHGNVDLAKDVALKVGDDYEITSPVAVIGDSLVVGSSIGDNRAVEEEFGIVRGFDARTGHQLWAWDPIPWARTEHPRTGAGNAWSTIAADPDNGLVFVPTGSASPDFYGVFRPGDNRDANSVVALDARTGRRVWGFQVVHHDLWDYDVAAEPTLFTFRPAHGIPVPAVAVVTKMGMVFVLNRLTGEPLFPVQERPVSQSLIAGEKTSPTQPFSSLPPLAPLDLGPNDISNLSPQDETFCRTQLASLVNEGIFTPVSTKDTLLYPGSIGGVNWGSAAVDDRTGILYANVNRLAYITRLVPQETRWQRFIDWLRKVLHKLFSLFHRKVASASSEDAHRFRAPDTGGVELSAQAGTPYRIYRAPFIAPDGMPCTPMPWGVSIALNLNTGQLVWRHALGTMVPGEQTGSPTLGGPIVTDGNLLFSAATVEPLLRAFNATTGEELWQGALPAPAQATPMTYQLDGRQYVVIAAGGHGSAGITQSDAVVAFALPESKDKH
jgi:quinoprotein glucose dehydrogenase